MLSRHHLRGARWASRVAVLAVLVAALLAATASTALALPNYRGVGSHALWFDVSNADLDHELDMARAANSNVLRVDVSWSSLESGGKAAYSQWYVDKLDRFVKGADARGMKVIAMVWATPCWASSAPESVKQGCSGSWWDRGVTAYPPNNDSDYADIVKWVTSRYGTKLAAVELWNEPNLPEPRFWNTPNKAARYAQLVKAAYPAAKAGNAAVPVLAGALASADKPFLDELYANGIQGNYDGISVHPYNENRSPTDLWKPEWQKYTFLPGLQWVRSGQTAHGDTKPLWITEFGWTTGTNTAWHVSEEQQGLYIRQAFGLLDSMPYVKAAAVYTLRNVGTDPSDFETNFGLVRQDFSAKPAYGALRDALAGAPVPGGLPVSGTPGTVQAVPTQAGTPDSKAPSAPVPAQKPGTAAPSTPVAARKAHLKRLSSPLRARVSLHLKRVGSAVVATGTAPPRTTLRLSTQRCLAGRAAQRSLLVRVGYRGRFARRLGTVRQLAGCRVALRVLRRV